MSDPIITPASNAPAKVSAWQRKLGPYAEVLTVVALSCAALCFIFADMPEARFGFGFGFLLAAIPCYSAALAHRELNMRNEEAQQQLTSAAKYRVTAARLEVLRTAKVPRDVLKALSALAGRDPMSKDELLSLLIYDLDLGHERTKDFEALILKYTKFDERPHSMPPPDGLPV